MNIRREEELANPLAMTLSSWTTTHSARDMCDNALQSNALQTIYTPTPREFRICVCVRSAGIECGRDGRVIAFAAHVAVYSKRSYLEFAVFSSTFQLEMIAWIRQLA